VRYLIAMWDGGGTVPPMLGVARRLVERGHRVEVLGDDTLAAGVDAVGARFARWQTAPNRASTAREDDLFKDWECRTPIGQFRRVRDRMVTGAADRYAHDVTAALEAQPAEAVLADGALLGALVGAQAAGVRHAVLVPNIDVRPAPDRPPLGLGLAPAHGPLGRARDTLSARLFSRLWNGGLPDLNRARARRSLPPLTDVWQQWDAADRVFVMTATAFDHPSRRRANVVYTGPVLDDIPLDGDPPTQLPEGEGPLVVVGLSSTWMRQEDLLRRIIAALDTLRGLGVRGLVTTGPAIDPRSVPSTPSVRVVQRAAHHDLFPEAAAVITHAGHGTLIKAMAAGTPAVCIPLGRDQRDNAGIAARAGAAIVLRPSADPRKIASAVRALLSDDRYRSAAANLSTQIRTELDQHRLEHELDLLADDLRFKPDGSDVTG